MIVAWDFFVKFLGWLVMFEIGFCCKRIAGVGSLKWKDVMVMFFGAEYHLKLDEILK